MELEKNRNNRELVDVSMEDVDTEGPNSSSKEIHVECAIELSSRAFHQAFAEHQSKEENESNQ